MIEYDWKKALDYILYIANQKEISQASLADDVITLSHFNKMCNGKEKVKAEIVLDCARKVGIDDDKIVAIARSKENVMYLEFKEKLDQILYHQNYKTLHSLKNEIEPYKNTSKYFSQLYYQISGLIEGSLNHHYDIALTYFKKALRVVYPKHKLDKQLISIYLSDIDLELLGTIAICNKNLGLFEEAIRVYLLILEYIEKNGITSKLYPKSCYNLARTFEKLKQYNKSLEYANKGIDYSIKHQIYSKYGNLYFAKAVAEFYLGIDNTQSFNTSIVFYKLHGRNEEFINQIKLDKEKYSLKKR